jgi:hypothetical protein
VPATDVVGGPILEPAEEIAFLKAQLAAAMVHRQPVPATTVASSVVVPSQSSAPMSSQAAVPSQAPSTLDSSNFVGTLQGDAPASSFVPDPRSPLVSGSQPLPPSQSSGAFASTPPPVPRSSALPRTPGSRRPVVDLPFVAKSPSASKTTKSPANATPARGPPPLESNPLFQPDRFVVLPSSAPPPCDKRGRAFPSVGHFNVGEASFTNYWALATDSGEDDPDSDGVELVSVVAKSPATPSAPSSSRRPKSKKRRRSLSVDPAPGPSKKRTVTKGSGSAADNPLFFPPSDESEAVFTGDESSVIRAPRTRTSARKPVPSSTKVVLKVPPRVPSKPRLTGKNVGTKIPMPELTPELWPDSGLLLFEFARRRPTFASSIEKLLDWEERMAGLTVSPLLHLLVSFADSVRSSR